MEAAAPSAEECRKQARRVLQSVSFRNAATLQSLFQFLTDKAISGDAESLKEATIGMEALGRKPGFDPKIDPIVRVQCHRLRLRLKDYYKTEGLHDPILIQFPKGHYIPTFGANTDQPKADESGDDLDVQAPLEQINQNGKRNTILWMVCALFFALLGYWLGTRSARSANPEAGISQSTDPVEIFWGKLLENDTSPVIAYPDAVFLLDSSNDLFRYRRGATDSRGAVVDPHVAREFASNAEIVAHAGQLYYENGYTGTGELESAAMLAGLLGRMGMHPLLKSSRDVSPDDLKQHDLILLGSPFQNSTVAQLMAHADFSYSNPDQHLEEWRAQIMNNHVRSGESGTYRTERDDVSKVLIGDYSLLTVTAGTTPGHRIVILGGLDTKGTEGVTQFATSKPGIQLLTQELNKFNPGDQGITPFQALVHVRLARGYQVLDADLVAFHPIRPASPEGATNPAVKTDSSLPSK